MCWLVANCPPRRAGIARRARSRPGVVRQGVLAGFAPHRERIAEVLLFRLGDQLGPDLGQHAWPEGLELIERFGTAGDRVEHGVVELTEQFQARLAIARPVAVRGPSSLIPAAKPPGRRATAAPPRECAAWACCTWSARDCAGCRDADVALACAGSTSRSSLCPN